MPLQKSTTNDDAPLLEEGKPHAPRSPVTRPNSPDSTDNRVILGKSGPASGRSTFTAPRREPSMAPFVCGYTKPGKM